jgi:arsenite methyltransferase
VGEIREAVRSRYADAARQLTVLARTGAELEPGCCGADGPDCGCGRAYAPDELRAVGLTDAVSLGCGNPVLLAELRPGDVVLDLGSGGGLDVLLTARRVGPDGHAYGVDMTDAMLELANRNKEKAGVTNATFLQGTIEQVPLPDEGVDVVMSNCVINLAEDKGAVIREAFRVLKPGGSLAVSDMVELQPLPAGVKKELDAWAGCIAGTIPVDEYRQLLIQAGFEAPAIEVTGEQGVGDAQGAIGSASIRARKPARDH